MYLIIVYQGQHELMRYSFADQRAQYNGALGILKQHPLATEWELTAQLETARGQIDEFRIRDNQWRVKWEAAVDSSHIEELMATKTELARLRELCAALANELEKSFILHNQFKIDYFGGAANAYKIAAAELRAALSATTPFESMTR